MYVPIYVFMHVTTQAYACNLCIYVHTCIDIYTFMYAHMFIISVYMYIHKYICLYAHICINMCSNMHTCIYIQTHICLPVYIPYVYIHIACIHTSESHDADTRAMESCYQEKSCCTSFWASWPKKCSGAINNAIGAMWC